MENKTEETCLIYILMSTYNGEKFLSEQLRSIEDQTHKNWRLLISDDGSTDNTLEIANQFQAKWGDNRLEIRQGPRQGFCQNFLSMACDTSLKADLYAFSDQDDVWMPEKLSIAVKYFKSRSESNLPRAYGGRTQIVNEALKPIGLSPEFALPRSFRNALVQSITGGNTQVFNQCAKELLEQAGRQIVVSHDWWLYQLVKGAGGVFHYDPIPYLLYRQHSNSLVGANASLRARTSRLFFVVCGRFKEWNDINYSALCNVRQLLTNENQDLLDIFGKFRQANFKDRLRLLEVCGLYRQTWKGTISLWFAAVIKKL